MFCSPFLFPRCLLRCFWMGSSACLCILLASHLQDCSFLWLSCSMRTLHHAPVVVAVLCSYHRMRSRYASPPCMGCLSLLADCQSRSPRCTPKLSCFQSEHVPLFDFLCALWENATLARCCSQDLHGRDSAGHIVKLNTQRKLTWPRRDLVLTKRAQWGAGVNPAPFVDSAVLSWGRCCTASHQSWLQDSVSEWTHVGGSQEHCQYMQGCDEGAQSSLGIESGRGYLGQQKRLLEVHQQLKEA